MMPFLKWRIWMAKIKLSLARLFQRFARRLTASASRDLEQNDGDIIAWRRRQAL